MSCLLLTTQLQAQCDCDPILTGGEDEVTESTITTAFPSTSSLTGGSYHITTDLTINTNFTLTGGVRFSIDPGVAIIVPAGVTFTITNNSILTAADDVMWAGIEVQATIVPGTVLVSNGATIANAETGIFLNNLYTQYAECRVTTDAFFCNNHIGILSNRYDGVQPSLIAESEFCGNNLLEPFAGEFGIGVRVEDMLASSALFTIGNATAYTPTTCNTFHDLYRGVDLFRSHALVQNNFFYDMDIAGADRGTGIYGESDINTLTMVMTAGDASITSGNHANRFRDCERGIHLENFYNAVIHRNRMTNTPAGSTSVMQEGIFVYNCGHPYNVQHITYNDIYNVDNRAIDMRDNATAAIYIKGNNINSSMTIPTGLVRRGISVRNTIPAAAIVEIDSNQINNMRNGIATFNYTEDLVIRGNTIAVTFPGGMEPASGILTENCSNVLIDLYDPSGAAIPNQITGTCTSGCDDQIIGINIQSCTDFRCYRNIVNDCYPGIRAEGDCVGGNFVCNDLDNCTTGFGLKNLGGIFGAGVDIELGIGMDREIFGGYYLVTGMIPSDNAWTPSSGISSTWANRTHAYGLVDPTIGEDLNWYYRDASNELDMEPAAVLNTDDGLGSVSIPTTSLINTPGFDIDIHPRCSFPMPRLEEEEEEGGGEMLMETEEGYADADSLFYSKMITDYADKITGGTLENPLQHLYEMGAFRLLSQYPDADWESEATATVVAWLEGSNTAAFFQIMDSIQQLNPDAAIALLDGLSTSSVAEDHYAYVLKVYTQGLDSNLTFTLPDIYRDDTKNIAVQHTLVAGEAVHIARAMLDTTIEFDGLDAEIFKWNNQNLSTLAVYPVPANDKLTINNLPVMEGTIQVYDIFGRMVQSNILSAESVQFILPIDLLQPGIYIMVLIDLSGNQVEQTHFIKQ